MKKIFVATFALAMVIFLTTPGRTLAAGNDTLVVYASGQSLDQVINSDTLSGGSQAHSVYKLVSLDTTYYYLGAVNVTSNITVIGVLGSDGRPPCIQPGVLQDGSVPATLFSMSTAGTTCRFENIYVFELSTQGTWTGGTTFNVTASNIDVYMNNVIDEENHYVIIWYSGDHDNFYLTNCKIRNTVNPTDWYAPQFVAPNGYLPVFPIDTLIMKYNSFFCTNGGAGGSTFTKYLEFEHNSVVFTNYTAMVPPPGNIGSAKIDNNIFYGVMAGGNSKSEFTWMDDPFQPEVASILDFDTLTLSQDSLIDPADIGKLNLRMLAEGKRNVEIKDNVYFIPKAITDFQTAWDDTAHADSLYSVGWMNARTEHMFNDLTDWPGLTQSGNMVGTDPGYGSSFANVLTGGTGYGVGLLDYVGLVRSGTVTTQEWGYHKQSVTGTNWVPNWPLPEAADMQYSNATVKTSSTDGKPVGDPYWFNGITAVKTPPTAVPAKFSLSNNYPNPFNPSTQINFSVDKNGLTSLKIYNVLGQLVMTVFEGNAAPHQNYSFNVSLDRFASGVYFYTLHNASNTITKKMLLLK